LKSFLPVLGGREICVWALAEFFVYSSLFFSGWRGYAQVAFARELWAVIVAL